MNTVENKINELKEAWGEYLKFLKEKYPPKEGEEFKLTCPHHKRITEILNEIN